MFNVIAVLFGLVASGPDSVRKSGLPGGLTGGPPTKVQGGVPGGLGGGAASPLTAATNGLRTEPGGVSHIS